MFTAANPHAKSPTQIQERCLNPALDTATSSPPAPAPLAAAVSGVQEASLAAETATLSREDKSLGGGTPAGQVTPGFSTGDCARTLPAAPGRGMQSCRSHPHGGGRRDAICPAAAEEVSWVGLGWLRAELWGISWQQGAQRGWEALGSCSQAKRGPSVPVQSCSRSRTQPSGAHLHRYSAPTSPPPLVARPCKASQPGHGLSPFSLIPHLQPRHPALHPWVTQAQPPRPPS